MENSSDINQKGGASALHRFAACLAFQFFVGAALAAADPPNLAAARALLDAGRAEPAAALLERDLLHYAGNADYDYLLGLAWYRAGQTGQALFAFERVAMVDPGNIDARLKAAQINLERGDAAAANELIAPRAKARPDAAQQQEIERLRTQIAAAATAKTAIRGYLQAGLGWDDNVTGGPDRGELFLPLSAPTATAVGSAARDHDRMLLTEAGVALRTALDDDTWLTGVGSIRQGDNQRRKDVKEGVANIDLGLLRRNGDDFFGVSVLAQRYLLGSALYRETLGGRVNWIHPVTPVGRVAVYGQHTELDYVEHPIDSAGRSIVGASYDGVIDAGAGAWQSGAYAGTEKAKDPEKPHFSYRLLGLHLGGSTTLNDDLSVVVAATYEQHRHAALDGIYQNLMRRDALFSLGLAADYKLAPRWRLLPRYTYTHNASNLELYQYARNTFTLQLRWDFDNGKN